MKKMILVIGEADAFGEAAIAELKTIYTVQSAPDAAHAKSLAQILSPALLVAFPEWINMDTVSEYEELIEANPSIPFAVMGTQADHESAELCFRRKVDNILLPLNPEDAFKQISVLLGENATSGVVRPAAGKTVLIIDDNPNTLRSMKAILDGKYRVLLAPSGDKGLQIMQSNLPAVVLLDYEMPGMDGKEVFKRTKLDPLLEQIPVIFLTAVNDKQKIVEILNLHPAGYLLKPSTPEKLIDAIERATGGGRS